MTRTFIAVAMASILCGCMAPPSPVIETGRPVPADVQLQPGVATIADAIRVYGQPTTRTEQAEGTVLSYAHVVTGPVVGDRHTTRVRSDVLLLYFDQGGRLLKQRRQESDNTNKMSY